MSKAAAILVGSDPEVFVTTPGGAAPGSAIGLIGGSKYEPRPVERGALQEDNVLAEFNIDPAGSEDDFVANLTTVLTILRNTLPKGVGVLLGTSSHEYTPEFLISQGEQAMEFGCDPDYDALTFLPNEPPEAAQGLRTAGGHLHVGIGYEPAPKEAQRIIRNMDIACGLPSVLMDEDTRRRSLYGGASAFRMKPYGVEYRTLSNFWLSSEELMRWAYRQTQLAADAAVRGEDLCPDLDWGAVRAAINSSDRKRALALLKSAGVEEYVCR